MKWKQRFNRLTFALQVTWLGAEQGAASGRHFLEWKNRLERIDKLKL